MAFSWSKKTESHETFITPDQFDNYSKAGYVIFMAAPTAFGTYKAVKITLVDKKNERKICDKSSLFINDRGSNFPSKKAEHG